MPLPPKVDTSFPEHLARVGAGVFAGLATAGADALVVHAGLEHIAFQDDQPYPYRTNPWFAWIAPVLNAPGSLILWRYNKRPIVFFVSPKDYWTTPPTLPTESWAEHFNWVEVPDAAAALALLPDPADRVSWIGEPPPPHANWAHNHPALLLELEQLRCRKSPYELACLREATRIGVAGHLAAEQSFRQGGSELAVHLAYLAAGRQNELDLPYGSIVALNEHAATLHYQLRSADPPREYHSLLIDAGASCRGYASDITRTYAANPGPFAALVEGMHRVQQELCSRVAPGIDWRDLHLAAHQLISLLLVETGVLRLPAADAVELGISSAFLPHGLGHLLGLQVHDVGGFRATADSPPIPLPPGHPALRMTRRLEAGMVVTVEPGIYFIDSLLQSLRTGPHAQHVDWSLIDALRPCGGIRIEDDVHVTAGGHENLTRAAFAAAARA